MNSHVDVSASQQERVEALARRLEAMGGLLVGRERQESLKESVGGSVTDGESTDFAAAMTDLLTADSLAGVLGSQRAQVLHALDRLRIGLYGVCEDCGEQIPEMRLEYQPEATRCLRCQAAWERGRGA